MAHITGAISISDDLTKSTTQTMLIALLAMNKFSAVIVNAKDVLRKIHLAHKQYITSPCAISGLRDLNSYMWNRACVGSWEILEKAPTLLIKCAIKGRRRKRKVLIQKFRKV